MKIKYSTSPVKGQSIEIQNSKVIRIGQYLENNLAHQAKISKENESKLKEFQFLNV
jgi:hypothetical protein